MKQNFFYQTFCLAIAFLLTGCTFNDAQTELEYTEARFKEELGCPIGVMQWWETSVKVQVDVVTDSPVRIWLSSTKENAILYDYKEVQASGTVTMTAPQGQSETLCLSYVSRNRLNQQELTLTGKPIETIELNLQEGKSDMPGKEQNRVKDGEHPVSLSGSSVLGNSEHYQLTDEQLSSFFDMMSIINYQGNYIQVFGLTDNYELESKGPFWVNWVSGWEELQTPHMLGYYYHSPGTYDDIVYVDISETHKWDYIDGLSKVQYQIGIEDDVAGFHFSPGEWYDANFDSRDYYGSTNSLNMDRIGDNAFNIHSVHKRYDRNITALRGISFLIDVPVGKHLGFFLRSDSEPFPTQWNHLKTLRIPPYVPQPVFFRGTCFSASDFNLDGKRRSVIWNAGSAIWMGMEDIVTGGDYDCNDLVFCVLVDMEIYTPDIITPDVVISQLYDTLFPWTLAFEDVNRDADFDFNDAVIKLLPDYKNERCCVTAMAVGSTDRMYLYYDGPEGEICLGEMHEFLGNTSSLKHINTQQSAISTPVQPVDCVPWPMSYSMEQDARRFSIRVQRGTCEDCMDTLSLPVMPGELPEALLVAGEWQWPMEDTAIISAYPVFPNWAQDPSRVSYWNWYINANPGTSVSH